MVVLGDLIKKNLRYTDLSTITHALEIVQVNAATVRGLLASPNENEITF